MKITQKSLQYILLLLVLVILVVAYRFGFVEYNDKTEVVERENKVLQARIVELTDKLNNVGSFEEGAATAVAKKNEILGRYGAGNTAEKSIMFVTKLEAASKAKISSVSFAEDELFYSSTAFDENGFPTISGYRTDITINFVVTYDGMKKMFDFIHDYEERMNVQSFNASYDQETGDISGSMIINLYSIADAEHEYVDPSVPGIATGKPNIFK